MTSSTLPQSTDIDPDYAQYRTVSLSAIATLVLGILSITGLMIRPLLFFGIVGSLIGTYSVFMLRRRQDEFTGLGLAKSGLALCLLISTGGISWHIFDFATEVPDGFERIRFYDLQSSSDDPKSGPPPSAYALDGKDIFVKGYVYPDQTFGETRRFVLIPDLKTCCFGGQPDLTDMIEVTLQDPLRVKYSLRLHKLAGTLKVSRVMKKTKLDGVFYQLDASHLK
ncbi:hypothetical protein ACFL2H_07135 [Planctomycetota bacterium]